MDILQNLQAMLGGQGAAPAGRPSTGSASGLGGLSSLLTPEVLGGLAGALFGGKAGGGGLGGLGSLGASAGGAGGLGALGGLLGSLLSGGGGLFGGSDAAQAPAPQAPRAQSDPRAQFMRLVRAMVYAAKADGHIDAKEQAAIQSQFDRLNLGPDGQAMLRQVMDEPIDPSRVAAGVADPQEAVQLYALSSAVIDPDQFMEKSYLDGLAKALGLPDNVKASIEAKLGRR